MSGRTAVFKTLNTALFDDSPVIWFHCASLGEFEQGRPIIENFKSQYANYKIVVTFFSPSGYEVRKEYTNADVVTYLPLDTKRNARKFIRIVKPKIAVFVKYEFWPNFLNELKKEQIPTILVSGIFRESQSFFKWYGSWMRTSLAAFNHFFVQNENSKKLLNGIGFDNITISGDTRFDRVFEITRQDNSLDFIERFIGDKLVLVAGSTWEKDEALLVSYINNHAGENEKFIIAPHTIDPNQINKLQERIFTKSLLYSDKLNAEYADVQVLIVDSIGILTKVYSYANIAYVGGGFGVGIHNILEPATFGVPILIGPNYKKFKEAVDLIEEGACIVVRDNVQLQGELSPLVRDRKFREGKGHKAENYIKKNVGATPIIIDYLHKILG